MTSHRLRRLSGIVVLTAVWCGLWGEFSLANVVGGALVGTAVTLVVRPAPQRIRLVPLARFVGLVVVDLVASVVAVATEILTPTDRTNESIVAVDLPNEAGDHLLLLVVAVTLTPGTAVVDAEPDTGTLYLHLLHDDRRDDVERHVRRLAGLACEALPGRRLLSEVTP